MRADPITEIVVVVPAADEAERIGACLDAIGRAADTVADRVRVRTVVALDRCTDATADVVATRAGVETICSTARNVGVARATGAAHALSSTDPGTAWLANTDADSLVPGGWLAHMLDAADSGRDLVVGTVVPGPGLTTSMRRRWSRHHLAADGHTHVHGANLGIRADAYLLLGGWAPLATGEDADLVDRADRAGLAVYRSGGCPVTTSARATGRAPHGFSSYLRDLAVGPIAPVRLGLRWITRRRAPSGSAPA